jgi:hypothetical protein
MIHGTRAVVGGRRKRGKGRVGHVGTANLRIAGVKVPTGKFCRVKFARSILPVE